MEIKLNENNFMTYKNKPLVRSGDTLYYGSMEDRYVIKLDVRTHKKVRDDLEVSDKITISLMHTDPNVREDRKIVKTGERSGLFNAVDLGEFWLRKALG